MIWGIPSSSVPFDFMDSQRLHRAEIRSMDSEDRIWTRVPALEQASIFEPQFSHLWNGHENNGTYLTIILRIWCISCPPEQHEVLFLSLVIHRIGKHTAFLHWTPAPFWPPSLLAIYSGFQPFIFCLFLKSYPGPWILHPCSPAFSFPESWLGIIHTNLFTRCSFSEGLSRDNASMPCIQNGATKNSGPKDVNKCAKRKENGVLSA